jgi:hypothetical protein
MYYIYIIIYTYIYILYIYNIYIYKYHIPIISIIIMDGHTTPRPPSLGWCKWSRSLKRRLRRLRLGCGGPPPRQGLGELLGFVDFS